MRGDFFDSNILVYAAEAGDKGVIAENLIASGGTVSVQVLNEFVNVARRKMQLEWPEIRRFLSSVRHFTEVVPHNLETHESALDVAQNHGLSTWDSNIVASALGARCLRLVSEDLQAGQLFDGRLRVVNPFA